MKRILLSLTLCAASVLVAAEDVMLSFQGGIYRENTEWCDIWIPNADRDDQPRVLLVGDSITQGYYDVVCRELKNKAYCAKFATSACVADPAFLVQLDVVLSQYQFTAIHFNNGLHGVDYTEDAYRVGYENVLKLIKKRSLSTKLVLALSTPLKEPSKRAYLNPLVDERNTVVRALAEKYDALVNDLHSISKGHPEYYKDPYHYKGEAMELQGQQVSDVINQLLAGK